MDFRNGLDGMDGDNFGTGRNYRQLDYHFQQANSGFERMSESVANYGNNIVNLFFATSGQYSVSLSGLGFSEVMGNSQASESEMQASQPSFNNLISDNMVNAPAMFLAQNNPLANASVVAIPATMNGSITSDCLSPVSNRDGRNSAAITAPICFGDSTVMSPPNLSQPTTPYSDFRPGMPATDAGHQHAGHASTTNNCSIPNSNGLNPAETASAYFGGPIAMSQPNIAASAAAHCSAFRPVIIFSEGHQSNVIVFDPSITNERAVVAFSRPL